MSLGLNYLFWVNLGKKNLQSQQYLAPALKMLVFVHGVLTLLNPLALGFIPYLG